MNIYQKILLLIFSITTGNIILAMEVPLSPDSSTSQPQNFSNPYTYKQRSNNKKISTTDAVLSDQEELDSVSPFILEKPIHKCLLHPTNCKELFTFTELKEHYYNSVNQPEITHCPVLLEDGSKCDFVKDKQRPIFMMYHLMRHHGIPQGCPFPGCDNKKIGNLRTLNHNILTEHPELVSDGMFQCPACFISICSSTDLINIFMHYQKGNVKTCANGKAKSKNSRKKHSYSNHIPRKLPFHDLTKISDHQNLTELLVDDDGLPISLTFPEEPEEGEWTYCPTETEFTHNKSHVPLLNENKDKLLTNNLEKTIHQCLLHPTNCKELFTFTELKKHYLDNVNQPEITHCPVLLEDGSKCDFVKGKQRPIFMMYHLMRHHGIPQGCPFPGCDNKKIGNLRTLNHNILTEHPELVSDGMFQCPACFISICSSTDLINIFMHYQKGNVKTCANGKAKSKNIRKKHSASNHIPRELPFHDLTETNELPLLLTLPEEPEEDKWEYDLEYNPKKTEELLQQLLEDSNND